MKRVPVTVTFYNVSSASELEAEVLKRVSDLQARYGHILGCHVFVDTPPNSRAASSRCRVRIGLAVPGELIVVGREQARDRAVKGVAGAFASIGRRLQRVESKDKRRGRPSQRPT